MSAQEQPPWFHYCNQDNLRHAWLGYIKAAGMSGIFSGKTEKALETEDGISNTSFPAHRSQCRQRTEQHTKRSHQPLSLAAPKLLQLCGCFSGQRQHISYIQQMPALTQSLIPELMLLSHPCQMRSCLLLPLLRPWAGLRGKGLPFRIFCPLYSVLK